MDYREVKKLTVILDFDGTMCRLFEVYGSRKISYRLHNEMKILDINFLENEDCFKIFNAITQQTQNKSELRKQAYLRAHEIITEAECEAVCTGVDVIGVMEFIECLLQNEIKIGIATNNSEECVKKYLENKGVSKMIPIVGRQALHPEHMKPSSWSLTSILKKTRSKYNETIFIGDSLNDYYCAQNCTVQFIGMASTEKKKRRFQVIEKDIEIVENYFSILRNLKLY